jgi:hypothetical protein
MSESADNITSLSLGNADAGRQLEFTHTLTGLGILND